jgi:DNA invertase Pin-like site-specific DNA recombinase
MPTVLAGLAQFERSLIMKRTQAGITRARELGVTFGRPVKLNPKQRRMIAERRQSSELAHDEFEVALEQREIGSRLVGLWQR